jgi:hypothetical protein
MFSTPFFRPTGAPPTLLSGSRVVETKARDDPLTTQKERWRVYPPLHLPGGGPVSGPGGGE